jgi:hypothetical protein
MAMNTRRASGALTPRRATTTSSAGTNPFYVIQGSVTIELAETGERIELKAGDVASFPKGTRSTWTFDDHSRSSRSFQTDQLADTWSDAYARTGTIADQPRASVIVRSGTSAQAIHQAFWTQAVARENLLVPLKADGVRQLNQELVDELPSIRSPCRAPAPIPDRKLSGRTHEPRTAMT